MTEQTVNVTPEATETSETPVQEPTKRFRFTRKQIAIAGATTVAAAGALYFAVKKAASKHQDETDEAPALESTETDTSV